jgi:hypothetical protein
MIRITKKLSENDSYIVIAQDINDKGAKQYLGFRDYDDVFPYIEEQVEKCFHEVMVGEGHRRPYFDYDKVQTAEEFENIEQLMSDFTNRMLMAITACSKYLFGVEIGYGEISFTECHRADKFSAHVHIPGYVTTLVNMKLMFMYVDKFIRLNWNMDGLDNQVYSKNQTLRLLGCHKKGKPKQVLTAHLSVSKKVDTLVCYRGFNNKAKELSLTDDGQELLNILIEKQTGKKLEEVIYSPKTSEFYSELCAGLAPIRFNDYGYWNKVMLALGHENAGLHVALEFSKKSHKFDRYAVEKLYERGRIGFNGKSLTCGTLMAYLKEDNSEVFKKLVNDNSAKSTSICFQDEILELQAGLDMDDDEPEPEQPKRKTKKTKTDDIVKLKQVKPPTQEERIKMYMRMSE